MSNSRAKHNRKIRQDALREWLSEKCTAQHLVDNIQKIENLDVDSPTFKNELDKYRVANDNRLKVMNKYIPDLKQVEQDNTSSDGSMSNLKAKDLAEAIKEVMEHDDC